eukprot:100908_1
MSEQTSRAKKFEVFTRALGADLDTIEGSDEDSCMLEVRLALQQQYSCMPELNRQVTKDLPVRRKWKWAANQLIKNKKVVSYFRSSGSTNEIAIEALQILQKSQQDEELQHIIRSRKWMEFGFDVFSIDHRYPLFIMAYELMVNVHNFHNVFNFSSQQFASFLYRIECAYNEHDSRAKYHSGYHALDVLLTLHWCLNHSRLIEQNLNDIETFALLLSAVVHDVGHNGRNNQFHVDTRSNLALTYHDTSPLENYHLATAFRCLYHSDSNWMSLFSAHLQKE